MLVSRVDHKTDTISVAAPHLTKGPTMATLSVPKWGRDSSSDSIMYVRKHQLDSMLKHAPKPSAQLQAALDRRRKVK